jgi:hypothetical protein
MLKSLAFTLSFIQIAILSFAQLKPVTIKCKVSDAKVNVSEVFSSVDFIKLETPKESLLTYPADIQIVDDYIIIFDGTRKIYMYTKAGKFVRQVGRFGRGPGEYVQLADMIVDKQNHLIEIFEDFRRRILVYDFNGKFIKENTGFVAASIGKDNKGNYLFFSEYYGLHGKDVKEPLDTEILLADAMGTVLSTFKRDFVPWGKFIAAVNASCIKEFEGELYFNPQRSCTIYKLANLNLKPFYQIDFGEKSVPKKYLSEGPELKKETYKSLQAKYITDVWGFQQTDKNAYFKFRVEREIYHVFYNKKQAKSTVVPVKSFVNDLAFVNFYSVNGTVDNKVIGYVTAIDFKNQMDDYLGKLSTEKVSEFKSSNPKLYDIYQNTTVDDNPIITIYSFK